ncbi:hypothetical protein BsWGS_18989 [Bradybaena similaris]
MLIGLLPRVGTVFILIYFLKIGGCLEFNITPGLPQRIVIPSNQTSSVIIQDIPPDTVFAVIQLHTQQLNLSLSSDPEFFRNSTKNGTNIGMVTMYIAGKSQFAWYVRTFIADNLTAVAYVHLYTQNDPIPGGCNQVFSLPIDASIVLTTRSHSTYIWFQWSNVATPQGQPLPDCESPAATKTLTYDVYASFVPERDFTEESYFQSIQGMLQVESIMGNAVNVFSVQDGPTSKSEVAVTSETDQGALYAVIVTRSDTGRKAAYITAITYACNFENGGCSSDSSALEIVFAVVLCFCGLFLITIGHSYFKTMLFLFGFTFTSLLAYLMLSIPHTLEDSLKLPVAAALGIVGGCLWVAYWYFCAFPIVSVLLPGMCAGYLIASVLFFTPLGNIWWWDTTLNYSVAFVCVILVFTVFLMAYQKVLSIISCGIVGSFMLLMCIAIPLRSSLRLIFLNSLYHQTEGGYLTVKVVTPFHAQDVALAVLWPVFAIAGIIFQFYRSKNQPPFEIPERHQRQNVQIPHRFSGTDEDNVINDDNSDDERTGLLARERSGQTEVPPSYQAIPS